jgi:hypothetical protein
MQEEHRMIEIQAQWKRREKFGSIMKELLENELERKHLRNTKWF